ncbi:MAG TPA: alpha/beta hydrolase [Xanthobacteraceae bacterium]|jgi:pimeloyl-ACP methyl ester carboxylesterase
MPWLSYNSLRIHYELAGPNDGPACVLVNGLTQYVKLWHPLRDALVARGFHVASFDMLGQGQSDKPSLFIEQSDQVNVLAELVAKLGDRPIFVAGISFGGVIALRYAIDHSDRIAGLVPMSSFAEVPSQLYRLGAAMRTGLTLGGTHYLQDLLFPMNFSSEWLEDKGYLIELATHRGWLINDVYALANLMESFLDFEPLTAQLPSISAPTMILTGEYDFLTPRALQDSLRVNIPNSAMVILPRAYHAFTLEKPELTAHLVARFAEDVIAGRWPGNRTIWVGPEQAGGDLTAFPAEFDHLRAIPVRKEAPEPAHTEHATAS